MIATGMSPYAAPPVKQSFLTPARAASGPVAATASRVERRCPDGSVAGGDRWLELVDPGRLVDVLDGAPRRGPSRPRSASWPGSPGRAEILKRRCTGNPRRRSTTMEERRRRTDATGNQEGRHPSRRPTGQARAASPVQVTSDLEHQRHNDQGHYCGDHLSSMAGISASYRNPCWAVRRVAADGACQRARHSAPSGCRRCTERALRYLGYLGRVPCPRYN